MVKNIRSQNKKSIVALFLGVYLCITGITPLALAEEQTAQTEISLEQAIDKALANDESTKKADTEVDITKEERNNMGDDLASITTDTGVDTSWLSLLSADLQWQINKKSLTTQQESVVINTTSKYWDVLTAQKKVKVAELGNKYALQLLQNAQAGNRLGTQSDYELLNIKTQYQTAQATLSSARNDLETAYVTLNQLIGLASAVRPILTDTVEYQPLTAIDLDGEVNRVLSNSPAVWSKEQAVTLQEYQQEIALYSGNYQPYNIREMKIDQANLDLASIKELTEKSTRSMYFSILSMEQNYAKAQESLKLAEDNLRIIKIKYDIGIATSAEVIAVEKSLEDARVSVFELICNHEYAKLTFEKPWAAS